MKAIHEATKRPTPRTAFLNTQNILNATINYGNTLYYINTNRTTTAQPWITFDPPRRNP